MQMQFELACAYTQVAILQWSHAMALMTCSECGRAVSSRAVACVGCGFPISQLADIPIAHSYVAAVPLTSTEIRWRALFFLATMLVGVIWTGLAEHEPTAGRLPVCGRICVFVADSARRSSSAAGRASSAWTQE